MSPVEGLHVRPADEADASRIASIHVRSKRSGYRAFMPGAYLDSLDQDDHRLFRWQPYFGDREDDDRAWIAFISGIPAGFVALERARTTEDTVPAGFAHLRNLHTAPEFRRRGVGRALLDAAVKDAQARGAPGLALWAHGPNEASRAFYERAGWRLDGAVMELEYRWPGGEFTLPSVRYLLTFE